MLEFSLLIFLITFYCSCSFKSNVNIVQFRLFGRIEDWESEDWFPDFAENIPKKKIPSKSTAKATPQPKQSSSNIPPRTTISGIPAPNANWRAASNPIASSLPTYTEPTPARFRNVDESFVELDYDDFERAMREEEMGGINPGGSSKVSTLPIDHEGMKSGDMLPLKIWDILLDAQGQGINQGKIAQGMDVVVVYADPRRMNDEFKLVLSEFQKIPATTLRVGMLGVNCDDHNDLRKYLKKNPVRFPLLADPSKQFMDLTKCRAKGRLSAALMLVEVRNNRVLKVWYENDWDVICTKDLVTDEIREYRANPVGYVQGQIGIR